MKKMSEVFDLPLAADGHGGLYDGYMERIGELNYNADAENIANALNCHDELVCALDDYVALLQVVVSSGMEVFADDYARAEETLKRIRGY